MNYGHNQNTDEIDANTILIQKKNVSTLVEELYSKAKEKYEHSSNKIECLSFFSFLLKPALTMPLLLIALDSHQVFSFLGGFGSLIAPAIPFSLEVFMPLIQLFHHEELKEETEKELEKSIDSCVVTDKILQREKTRHPSLTVYYFISLLKWICYFAVSGWGSDIPLMCELLIPDFFLVAGFLIGRKKMTLSANYLKEIYHLKKNYDVEELSEKSHDCKNVLEECKSNDLKSINKNSAETLTIESKIVNTNSMDKIINKIGLLQKKDLEIMRVFINEYIEKESSAEKIANITVFLTQVESGSMKLEDTILYQKYQEDIKSPKQYHI